MAIYRVAIRYGDSGAHYEILEVQAETLREALRRAADELPEEADTTADLAEVRLQLEPDAREYTEG